MWFKKINVQEWNKVVYDTYNSSRNQDILTLLLKWNVFWAKVNS